MKRRPGVWRTITAQEYLMEQGFAELLEKMLG